MDRARTAQIGRDRNGQGLWVVVLSRLAGSAPELGGRAAAVLELGGECPPADSTRDAAQSALGKAPVGRARGDMAGRPASVDHRCARSPARKSNHVANFAGAELPPAPSLQLLFCMSVVLVQSSNWHWLCVPAKTLPFSNWHWHYRKSDDRPRRWHPSRTSFELTGRLFTCRAVSSPVACTAITNPPTLGQWRDPPEELGHR